MLWGLAAFAIWVAWMDRKTVYLSGHTAGTNEARRLIFGAKEDGA